MNVRMFTVGPVQENCFLLWREGSTKALIVDPGDEAPKLLGAIRELGLEVEAILVTHCHFDHIGAVAPVAQATGAPVYISEIEAPVLADVMRWTPPGFGPFESYQAEHLLKGGEKLELAGFEIDVLFTPGHSPVASPTPCRTSRQSSLETSSSSPPWGVPTYLAAIGAPCCPRSAR